MGHKDLVYMILEYVPNAEIFELIKVSERLGEDAGRFFLK